MLLSGVNAVAKEAGKDFQGGTGHLELLRPLEGGPRHHSQTCFGATSRRPFTFNRNNSRHGFVSFPFSTEPFRGTILG